MHKWNWFSLGIVVGMVSAVGFGFAAGQPATEADRSPQAPATRQKKSADQAPARPAVRIAQRPRRASDEQRPPADGKLRIIAFGAHPDDCEIRQGGTGALWAAMGHHVKFVSLTNGDIGHWQMAGGPLAVRRLAEVQQAARILGVDRTQVLDIHDGELEPTLKNRKTVTRLIRGWDADIVISHRPHDYHPDHRYTGVLVQDAAYMVAVPFICPDAPHLRKNPVFLFNADRFQKPTPFQADVVVAIDEVIERKLDALAVMESQFFEGGALGYQRGPIPREADARKKRQQQVRDSFRRRFASIADRFRGKLVEFYGENLGKKVRYAEAFEVCEYGRQPSKSELRQLFPFFPPGGEN